MPEDRFFHPRLRSSAKVSALTYLERCVWEDMVLGCDDFGVIPFKPAKVRADNDRFALQESEASIRGAMDRVLEVGLFIGFTHQEQHFACDPLWQDFQKVTYPRRTYHPAPTPEVFNKLSVKTRQLFNKHSNPPEQDGHRLKAKGSRLTANGSRLTANGRGEREGGSVGATPTGRHGFDVFWAAYPKKASKEDARAVWNSGKAKTGIPIPALDVLLPAITRQKAGRSWIEGFVPNPATWLRNGRWQDEVQAAAPFGTKTAANVQAAKNVLDKLAQ